MIEHRPSSSNDSDSVNYKFSESEWNLIIEKYKNNQSKLSPVTRSNITRLINSMATLRTISTVQQANLIIVLLLCKEDIQEIEEINCSVSFEKKADVKEKNNENRIVEVNEIVERLRLLTQQYQALDNHRHISHGLLYDWNRR